MSIRERLARMRRAALLVAAGAVLAACGGGDAPEPVAPDANTAVSSGATPDAAAAAPATPALPAAPVTPVPTVTVTANASTTATVTVAASADTTGACAPAAQRADVLAWMRDQYYWADGLAAPDTQAADIDAYFRSMLYKPLDRYSYTQASADYNQFFADGTRTGYGYTLVWADAAQTTLVVRAAEPLSPVGLAGLKRGDTVLAIDGHGARDIAAGTPGKVTQAGIAREFLVRGADGSQRRFTVASASYALSTVAQARVIDQATPSGRVKVAYMAYNEFIVPSESALDRAFQSFVAAGAQELVLDLRYNGGGSVVMARGLASMIAGPRLDQQTFVELRYNAKHAGDNWVIPFISLNGLIPGPVLPGLQRLVVITSPETASASELVINALRPFMPVVLVGGTTYGKPYGFAPREKCGVTYSAVNFESFNARGVGGYVNGFAPTCAVADDLDHALGDEKEARLAASLSYIANGSCPAGTSPASAPLARGKQAATAVFGDTVVPRMWIDR